MLDSIRRGGRRALLSTCLTGCVIPISSTTAEDGGTSTTGGDAAPASTALVTAPDGAAPKGSWTNVSANLANMASECGNLSSVFVKPDEDIVLAGVALHGLWAMRDGSGTWTAIGTGMGSATITNHASSLVFDPSDSMRYWESGIYGMSGGVYETTDDGNTFKQLGNVFHDDLVSVDLSDPQRLTLLAGGHEEARTLYKSSDGGMTWANVGASLPAITNCTLPLVINSTTYLVGCAGFGGGPTGVHRTTDGGMTWPITTTSGGVSAPLVASDKSIYWANPNGGGITRSTDEGKTWSDVVGPGVVQSVHPIELPDKRLATLGTQAVIVSADHGATWTAASVALPYSDAGGLVYSAARKAFYVWHSTCGTGSVPVPTDAIMRYNFAL